MLTEHGFSEDGLTAPEDKSLLIPSPDAFSNAVPSEYFKETIDEFNAGKPEEMQIRRKMLVDRTETDPNECVYVFLDDVGVKHQKDTRKEGGTKDGKNVENTVIRVHSGNQDYRLTATNMGDALKQLLAFLIFNNLLQNKKLCFFSDGAANIKNNLRTYFGCFGYQLRLDWYHLELHLDQALSQALWKSYRDKLQPVIMSMLWAGNINEAMGFLTMLKQNKKAVKSQNKLQEAIDYLKRKRPYIDCYALRKECGFINSSNPAEKENDLIVAQRQKHNGMAWSYAGSGALAAITASMRNDEFSRWLRTGNISFTFSARA